MPKLNLKDIHFKQFFIEKGERVLLWAMVSVMAVLIVVGVFINGFSRGSAASTSSEIMNLYKAGQAAVDRSQPSPDLLVLDPYYTKAAAMPRIDFDSVQCNYAYFMALASEDKKWRKPEVLSPDEFQVSLLRGLVRSYIPATKNNKPAIMFLRVRVAKGEKEPKAAPPGGPGMRNRGPNMQRMGMMARQPGGMGGMMGGMMGAMPGMPGARPGQQGMMHTAPSMPSAAVVGEDGRDVEMYSVLVTEADSAEASQNGGRPAQAVVPMRMAVVQAAFPYRRQIEVFQRALRFKTIEEMEKEAGSAEFLGVNVQRREVGPDGKPTAWKDLDLISPLRPFLAFGIEPEDATLAQYGIIWNEDRLVIPRPFLARDQQYPAVELAGIEKTLKAIEQASLAGAPPPKPMKSNNRFGNDFDIFRKQENANGDMKGPMGPMGPMAPMRPPGVPVQKGPMGPMGPMGPAGAAAAFGTQDRLLPEKCLIRFQDVQLEPGKTYEYRIQVKMANPLFEKKDAAISKELTKNKEMVGEWTVVSKKVSVPAEGEYYFVEDQPKPRGPDQVWAQIHRWFDSVPINPAQPRESLTAVGDWSVARQSPAVRGEYIGRWEDVELPIWNPKQETFVMAQHPDVTKRKGVRNQQHKGVSVDFHTGALLVDFEGGKTEARYRDKAGKEVPAVKDESAIEALVLTPEGRLIVRGSRKDADDKERQERDKACAEHCKAMHDMPGMKGDKKPGGFFDEKKP